MLLSKPPLKIVATLVARDEEDIIQNTLEHHLENGVSQFVFTDNNSRDNTRNIVAKYKEVVEIFDEPDDSHRQAKSVNRMLKVACKLKPDWIIHIDADELWCGLNFLLTIRKKAFASHCVFIHPPTGNDFDLRDMRHYLNFETIPRLDGESKVGHRPNEDILICHGNHGFENVEDVEFTKAIFRHHYPIRSYAQFERKTVQGHRALMKRAAPCPRWQRWYGAWENNRLPECYRQMVETWKDIQHHTTIENIGSLLEMWSEPEAIALIRNSGKLPVVGEWPHADNNTLLDPG